MTDIVEQLRHPYTDREEIMRSWDAIREYLLDGKLGTYARDIFESILSNIDWEREQAADEIDRLNAECIASMTEIANLRSENARIRRETIEECAAWHDHCAEAANGCDEKYAAWHTANAAAIRALAENTGGDTP